MRVLSGARNSSPSSVESCVWSVPRVQWVPCHRGFWAASNCSGSRRLGDCDGGFDYGTDRCRRRRLYARMAIIGLAGVRYSLWRWRAWPRSSGCASIADYRNGSTAHAVSNFVKASAPLGVQSRCKCELQRELAHRASYGRNPEGAERARRSNDERARERAAQDNGRPMFLSGCALLARPFSV
jgi:hypothetical protein